MIIAQGQRGTSATLGKHDPKNYVPLPRESASGERDKGRGVSQFDRPPIAILNYCMPETNQTRQPTPGYRSGCNWAPAARRGCALRSAYFANA